LRQRTSAKLGKSDRDQAFVGACGDGGNAPEPAIPRGIQQADESEPQSAGWPLVRPVVAAEDVAADQSGGRRQVADAVFDSFALQLDLSFAAAVYGLAVCSCGSLIGEPLTTAVPSRHPASLRIRGRTY
jgi:hypothetical protein